MGRTDTGQAIGSEVYEYSTTVTPIALDPNTTYWLSIVNDTTADTNDSWYWALASSLGNGALRSTDGTAWSGPAPFSPNGGGTAAFFLTGDVPEPATLSLTAAALIGCLHRRRR